MANEKEQELLRLLQNPLMITPSAVCRLFGFQNCGSCEHLGCADNTNPELVELKNKIRELERNGKCPYCMDGKDDEGEDCIVCDGTGRILTNKFRELYDAYWEVKFELDALKGKKKHE